MKRDIVCKARVAGGRMDRGDKRPPRAKSEPVKRMGRPSRGVLDAHADALLKAAADITAEGGVVFLAEVCRRAGVQSGCASAALKRIGDRWPYPRTTRSESQAISHRMRQAAVVAREASVAAILAAVESLLARGQAPTARRVAKAIGLSERFVADNMARLRDAGRIPPSIRPAKTYGEAEWCVIMARVHRAATELDAHGLGVSLAKVSARAGASMSTARRAIVRILARDHGVERDTGKIPDGWWRSTLPPSVASDPFDELPTDREPTYDPAEIEARIARVRAEKMDRLAAGQLI